MTCSGLETLTDKSLTGILSFPNTCDYYFYAKLMGAFFIILSLLLYNKERERSIRSDFISCMGVSAIATIFISLIGTFLTIIEQRVFIEIFVFGMIFVAVWIFKK